MERDISFALNGESVWLKVEEGRVLRSDLGLTGTKFGCGASLGDIAGKHVMTIEGLSRSQAKRLS